MTNLGIDQLAPRDGPASGGSWKNHGKAGPLKPWKPRPTIYCRAGLSAVTKISELNTVQNLNSNRHIFARSAYDGQRRTRGLSLSVQARPAPFMLV